MPVGCQKSVGLVLSTRTREVHLGGRFRYKLLVKLEHGELGGVEDLVAELAVAFYTEDIQVDITT